jgi:hypothetical protein
MSEYELQIRLIIELTNKLESQIYRDNNIPESYRDLVKVSFDYLNNNNIDRLKEYLGNIE